MEDFFSATSIAIKPQLMEINAFGLWRDTRVSPQQHQLYHHSTMMNDTMLHYSMLVLGWVTIFGQVYHLGL